jgi:hypothetical protein
LLNSLKHSEQAYSFVSLSGGFQRNETNIEIELMKRSGLLPQTVLNPLIADLLRSDSKTLRKDLHSYKISRDEAVILSKQLTSKLKQCLTKIV